LKWILDLSISIENIKLQEEKLEKILENFEDRVASECSPDKPILVYLFNKHYSIQKRNKIY
jgi:hypothetical protein